jgi:hypothetical protein
MNPGANFGGTYGGSYALYISATEISYNAVTNTSVVQVSVYMNCSVNRGYYDSTNQVGNCYIGGTEYTFNTNYSAGTGNTTFLSNQTQTIAHNANGTGSVYISAYQNANNSPGLTTASVSGTLTLTTLDENSITGFSASAITPTAFTVNVTTSESCSAMVFSNNNGSSYVGSGSGTSGSYTFTGLTPNTVYNCYCEITDSVSGGVTTSSLLQVSTAPAAMLLAMDI